MVMFLEFSNLGRIVVDALMQMIRETKGNCLTFYPKKVAMKAGLSTKPVTLSVVNYFLKELEKEGLIERYKMRGAKRVYYIIYSSSPLWKKAKGMI